jgi:hypothetical protein
MVVDGGRVGQERKYYRIAANERKSSSSAASRGRERRSEIGSEQANSGGDFDRFVDRLSAFHSLGSVVMLRVVWIETWGWYGLTRSL